MPNPMTWACRGGITRPSCGPRRHGSDHAALAEGGKGFSAGVLTPLQAGAALSAQDYIAALQARSAYMAELDAVLAGVDALVLPTSAIVTPLRGQDDAPTRHGRLMVREAVLGQTLPFSFAGVPAISLPAGHIWLEKGIRRRMGRRRDRAARWPCPSACSWWAAGVPMPACWRWLPGWKRSWRRRQLSRLGAKKQEASATLRGSGAITVRCAALPE